jgi:RNA polymerase sigma-70 factor (ECF subfamily)
MIETSRFRELIARVRAGEDEAAAELVRRYEPQIRREVRLRLTDPGLRRMLDSVDICQSVLGNFFARAALGQFDLKDPRQLLQLLATMARNRLIYWARKQQAARRDQRRQRSLAPLLGTEAEPRSGEPSPSQSVAGAELLEKFRARLSSDERQIAERRAAGQDWTQIAADLGRSSEALRKRLARAIDRVSSELGLELSDGA